MRSKKLAALLMTTALCATSLIGCGSDDSSNATTAAGGSTTNETTEEQAITCTLTVWSPEADQSPDNGEWLQTMCQKFATEHPNWTIEFKYGTCSEADAGTNVSQDPSASADVYMFANDQLKTLVEANAISQLGGETATYVQNTNSATIVDSVTYDGGIYGIPYTTNVWFMYYDKSVFTEEDVKDLDTMLAKGKVSLPIDNSWYTQAFFLAAGCKMGPDEAPELDFSGDAGLKAANYMIDLIANPNFVATDDSAKSIALLQDGQVNAAFSGSWDVNSAREFLGDNFATAAIPTITFDDGTSGQLIALAGSKALGVNPNTEYPVVAVSLAKFLASEEAQKAKYEAIGVVPCNTALLEDAAMASDPVFVAQNASFDNASILQQKYLTNDNWWTPGKAFVDEIIAGTITKDNAAEKVEEFNTTCNDNLN